MGNYSKLYGSLTGGIIGFVISRLGLPAALATPEVQGALTIILSALATWAFPANKTS
jgi:hypothetical protein